ncbi:MAG: DNA gyrase inhibitor YacG [Nitrospirae bacterium]|nr:MAG: DNA gyrase inhibitor YacG [Nitrospirota bacterium]
MKIRCPLCKKMTTWEENPNRPFCSEICRRLDLGAWASGDYRIEGPEEEQTDVEDEQEST